MATINSTITTTTNSLRRAHDRRKHHLYGGSDEVPLREAPTNAAKEAPDVALCQEVSAVNPAVAFPAKKGVVGLAVQ
nr:hypothetical protein Itr_chr09CG04680 [Ipomoea trifida]